ncbi:MAG TPA: glucoamylase family protein [Candidatus Ozemobacteraceae bacterium]
MRKHHLAAKADFTSCCLPVLLLAFFISLPVFAAPRLSEADSRMLDHIQQRTLAYFWDFGHPVSGLAPERNTTPDTVTTGGTGFGLMAMLVGVERGWLSRNQVLNRCLKIVSFLERADRFHGAWPHWLDGHTGRTIPFSPFDDGGDIVETSFLVQGLLTVRAYYDGAGTAEALLRRKIDRLWHDIEWDWYTRGEQRLYWHWSSRHGWKMNLPIRGYNECLITYVLAASSPTHPISARAYHEGWATGPTFLNGTASCGGITLPLGPELGGPLFISQYSFLGLDPRGLKDRYADYWEQNVRHAMINYLHCQENPHGYPSYSPNCWGLTSCDNPWGYDAHSPTNDLGVIAPTAALSSMPYTPAQSLRAARYFHDVLGDGLFGRDGFKDAFCPHLGWIASSTLAIDQGPIVIMLENFRSGLLWRLFMSVPEVRNGLAKLDFTFPGLPRTTRPPTPMGGTP